MEQRTRADRRWIGLAVAVAALVVTVALSVAVGSRTVGLSTVWRQVVAQGPPAEIMTAELVEEVFSMPCRVIDDPETGTPMVVPADRQRRRLSRTAASA